MLYEVTEQNSTALSEFLDEELDFSTCTLSSGSNCKENRTDTCRVLRRKECLDSLDHDYANLKPAAPRGSN